jgi:hypothetical protein
MEGGAVEHNFEMGLPKDYPCQACLISFCGFRRKDLKFIFPFCHCLYYVVTSLVSIHVCYTYRTTIDPLDIEPILIFLIGVKCVEQVTY